MSAAGPRLREPDGLPVQRECRLRVLHGDREVFSAAGEDRLRRTRCGAVVESRISGLASPS